MAIPNPERQNYFGFTPDQSGKCEYFQDTVGKRIRGDLKPAGSEGAEVSVAARERRGGGKD